MEQQSSEDPALSQTVRCSDFALKASNPSKLFALYSSLVDLNAIELQKKINRYIEDETNVKQAFFIFLDQTSQDGIVQVISDTELEKDFRFVVTETAFKQCIFATQASKVEPSRLGPDLLRVVCAAGALDNLYCVPVSHPTRGLAVLYCLGGYSPGLEYNYSLYVTECLRHCVGTVLNTLAYEEQKRLHLRCYSLLKGARNLITHLGDVTDLLREIMTEARKLTNAERCSLFLLDEQGDLESKVFDGFKAGEPVTEVRIKSGQGIAGHVAQSGVLVNIRDAYNHPLFYREVDKHTGFRTRNILCFPIVDESRVIGVAELVNKVDGTHFDQFDEEVAMAFSVYCGISIMHSLVYKKVQDAQARSKLSNELMMYYMKVSDEDVQRVLDCKTSHDFPDFTDFSFNPRNIPISETPCLCLKMFQDMGFIKHFNIPVHTLTRFILYAQRGYRDTPYHNWSHAFAVLHFAFIVMKNCRIMERKHLTPLEGLALLVSAMCHDIDHRGTTNQFQLRSGNSLARLYSSEGSVMERHHVSQTMCILNTEGCNIVAHLDEGLFKQFIDLISEMILATDMVVHFKMLPEEKQMAVTGFDEGRDRHRELLRGLVISCADISDQTKDWAMCRRVAKLIYDEFFTQGDLEKAMGVDPIEMMDREKAKIPDLQVEFLSHVVIPVFQKLIYDEFFTQGDLEKAMGVEPMEMMDREKAKIPDLQVEFLSHVVIPVFQKLIYDEFFTQGDLEKAMGVEPMEMMDREKAKIPDLQVEFLSHVISVFQKLIYDEFFTQGDLEKAMGVDPMEMMDREKAKIPDLQVEFLSHVVIPVFQKLIYDEFFTQGDLEKAMGVDPMEMMDREKAKIPDLQVEFLSHVISVFQKLIYDEFFTQGDLEKAMGVDPMEDREKAKIPDLQVEFLSHVVIPVFQKLIYDEFFTQGDLEKAMGVDPMEMMDREKAKIPDLQVEFLSHVVIPVYEVLVSLYPEASACLEQIRHNLACWQKAVSYFQDQTRDGKSAIEILSDSRLDDILLSTEE